MIASFGAGGLPTSLPPYHARGVKNRVQGNSGQDLAQHDQAQEEDFSSTLKSQFTLRAQKNLVGNGSLEQDSLPKKADGSPLISESSQSHLSEQNEAVSASHLTLQTYTARGQLNPLPTPVAGSVFQATV